MSTVEFYKNNQKVPVYTTADAVVYSGSLTLKAKIDTLKLGDLATYSGILSETNKTGNLYYSKPKFAEVFINSDKSKLAMRVNGRTLFTTTVTGLSGLSTTSKSDKSITLGATIKFGEMVETNTYKLAANNSDITQTLEIGSMHLWKALVRHLKYPACKVRVFNTDDSGYIPNSADISVFTNDAQYVPDGFPVALYLLNSDSSDATFCGLYSWLLFYFDENSNDNGTKANYGYPKLSTTSTSTIIGSDANAIFKVFRLLVSEASNGAECSYITWETGGKTSKLPKNGSKLNFTSSTIYSGDASYSLSDDLKKALKTSGLITTGNIMKFYKEQGEGIPRNILANDREKFHKSDTTIMTPDFLYSILDKRVTAVLALLN